MSRRPREEAYRLVTVAKPRPLCLGWRARRGVWGGDRITSGKAASACGAGCSRRGVPGYHRYRRQARLYSWSLLDRAGHAYTWPSQRRHEAAHRGLPPLASRRLARDRLPFAGLLTAGTGPAKSSTRSRPDSSE